MCILHRGCAEFVVLRRFCPQGYRAKHACCAGVMCIGPRARQKCAETSCHRKAWSWRKGREWAQTPSRKGLSTKTREKADWEQPYSASEARAKLNLGQHNVDRQHSLNYACGLQTCGL